MILPKIKIGANRLQVKLSLFIFLVILTTVICQLLLNSAGIQKYFSIMEKNDIETDVTYANKIWENEIHNIGQTAIEYSRWDEVYSRMETGRHDETFFRENFTEWLPEAFGIDIIIILDNAGNTVLSKGVDAALEKTLIEKSELKGAAAEKNSADDVTNGYFEYAGKLYIVAKNPITRSDGTGPIKGLLLLGRELDDDFVASSSGRFGYDMFFAELDGKLLSASKHTYEELGGSAELDGSPKVTPEFIAGTAAVYDISGKKVALLGIVETRDFMADIYRLMERNTVIAIAMSSIIIFIWGLILKNEVIKPIKRLEEEISEIRDEEDLHSVSVHGPQEIMNLASAFNTMVDNIRLNREENSRLKKKINMDELTGVHNRKCFYEDFGKTILKSRGSISIILCDIDRFREVNNTYGYFGGDMFLKEIASILKETLGERGRVFRYAGEQFIAMLPEAGENESLQVAERIRKNTVSASEKLQMYFRRMPFTVSIGIVEYPLDSSSLEVLIQKAKLAVHNSKQNGGNMCSIYTKDMEESASAGMKEYFEMKGLLDSVLAFARAIDTKDSYTGEHSDLVAKYSLLIADKLGMLEKDKIRLRIGALLHDSGKLGIPDSIINKTSWLTEEEYESIKRHSLLGEDIIKGITNDEKVVACVRSHHERWDGCGYPDGLCREEIPLYARIVSIADSFHAMTSKRPYREALTVGEALAEMEMNKGTQFDPNLVELFIEEVRKLEGSGVHEEAAASKI